MLLEGGHRTDVTAPPSPSVRGPRIGGGGVAESGEDFIVGKNPMNHPDQAFGQEH